MPAEGRTDFYSIDVIRVTVSFKSRNIIDYMNTAFFLIKSQGSKNIRFGLYGSL